MRSQRMLALLGAVAIAGVGCELIAGLENRTLADGGAADAAFEAQTNGSYTLSISPTYVAVDPAGPPAPVTITIVRENGFVDSINITVEDAPGISGSTTIPGTGSTGTLNVFAAPTASIGFANAVVNADTNSMLNATAPLGVRVGKVLITTGASTTFIVPADVQSATIAAWGAGGGGGGVNQMDSYPGGPGGGGGFAEVDVALTPGSLLQIVVGRGGAAGTTNATEGVGGAGGGYSAVATDLDAGLDAATVYVVAGAGGGGGGGTGQGDGGGTGANGGPGSGSDGGNGSSARSGQGGSVTAGGTAGIGVGCAGQDGAYGKGGSAANPVSVGGAIGGGSGGSGGGGGGGSGYFGGGGGLSVGAPCATITMESTGAGGGGSGYALPAATNVIVMTAAGATAANTSHVYYLPPVGMGGSRGNGVTTANAGVAGGVVIYLK